VYQSADVFTGVVTGALIGGGAWPRESCTGVFIAAPVFSQVLSPVLSPVRLSMRCTGDIAVVVSG